MSDNQFTSAARRAATTLVIVLALVCAACSSMTSTPRTTTPNAVLEQRAADAVAAGNLAAAADLYTQLAAGASGTARAGYLLEAARLAADYGDTALARRRVSEARGNAVTAREIVRHEWEAVQFAL